MKISDFTIFLLPFLLFSLLQIPTIASKNSYVVYCGAHSHGKLLSPDNLDRVKATVKATHRAFLEPFLTSGERAEDAIFYSYAKHINGFAAHLNDDVAAEIANHPDVISVFLNKGKKLHTTRSWDFLGLEHNGVVPSSSIWKKARFGEDTIIANLDTGVWPESKSFSDVGLGPIPTKWKGVCQNGVDATFHCNRKLIGARFYNKGYASVAGPLNSSFDSPRDTEGHGTHTLSTAGGNFVAEASVFGQGLGTAKGGSPHARVAAYKVCWPPINRSECFDADILAAFDAAIHDGVDVISVSLGGEPTGFFNDSVAIGSFHAARHGIVVVCSAGNSGPTAGTVSNVAPWQITVGASTMDREFASYVILGNKMQFKGASLSGEALPDKFFPIISALDAKTKNASDIDALRCIEGSLDREKVKGKILVCLRGVSARVEKGRQCAIAGAVGFVLANDIQSGNEVIADAHFLPATHIGYAYGVSVFNYATNTSNPVAYITKPKTVLGVKPAPVMAAFSSQGPNVITPEILKPDITAPGVSVIAAYTELAAPTNEYFDERRVAYNAISGTSMSCPHISGIAGLLKTIYPYWTPAAVLSAIMTTATTLDNIHDPILNASKTVASPFSYGAGHVVPNNAMDPGLVYDLNFTDYLNFLCALGYNQTQISLFSLNTYSCANPSITLTNFNYPSITIPKLSKSITVRRTLKNVGQPATYSARIRKPSGLSISVNPKKLEFKNVGEEKSFEVSFKVKKGYKGQNEYALGELIWSDHIHNVRSPILVKTVQ